MANEEQRVRDAARELNEAILAARSVGLRVDWPPLSEGLATIAISAGRKTMTPDEIGQAAKAQAEREQRAEAVAAVPTGAPARLDQTTTTVMPRAQPTLTDVPGKSL